jgi:hypothetical protein
LKARDKAEAKSSVSWNFISSVKRATKNKKTNKSNQRENLYAEN